MCSLFLQIRVQQSSFSDRSIKPVIEFPKQDAHHWNAAYYCCCCCLLLVVIGIGIGIGLDWIGLDWNKIAHGFRKGNVFGLHYAQRNLCLHFRNPEKRAALVENHISGS